MLSEDCVKGSADSARGNIQQTHLIVTPCSEGVSIWTETDTIDITDMREDFGNFAGDSVQQIYIVITTYSKATTIKVKTYTVDITDMLRKIIFLLTGGDIPS